MPKLYNLGILVGKLSVWKPFGTGCHFWQLNGWQMFCGKPGFKMVWFEYIFIYYSLFIDKYTHLNFDFYQLQHHYLLNPHYELQKTWPFSYEIHMIVLSLRLNIIHNRDGHMAHCSNDLLLKQHHHKVDFICRLYIYSIMCKCQCFIVGPRIYTITNELNNGMLTFTLDQSNITWKAVKSAIKPMHRS